MGEKFDKFCSDLRTKIDDADKHLKGLQASAKNAGQKARDDAKAHLAALEDKAKEQQAKIDESKAQVKADLDATADYGLTTPRAMRSRRCRLQRRRSMKPKPPPLKR